MVTRPTRQEIEGITGGNRRLTRAFELLFSQLNTTTEGLGDQQAAIKAQNETIQAQTTAISRFSGQLDEFDNRIAGFVEVPGVVAAGDQLSWDSVEEKFNAGAPKEWVEKGTASLDAIGEAAITFANPILPANAPRLILAPRITSAGVPAIVNVVDWVSVAGEITGATIRGVSLIALPASITAFSELEAFTNWQASDSLSVDWILF